MDREKLDKAAEEYRMTANVTSESFCLLDIDDAFEAGADWLMQQPLSERLTEAEKERIMGLVNYVGENAHDSEARAMRDELETIFGADLFKEK